MIYLTLVTTNGNDGNLSLQKGQIFETFEEVEKYLMQYCEQKDFTGMKLKC